MDRYAEMIAIAEAEREIRDAGYTVHHSLTRLMHVPGVGSMACVYSMEVDPDGEHAMESFAHVREQQ